MNALNILIIGAGGVASYLTPVIARLGVIKVNATIMDGDVLEERNLDRQLFPKLMIGQNKAKALVTITNGNTLFRYIPHYFNPNTIQLANETKPDCVICLVDNKKSRVAIYEWAMEQGHHFITASNELFDASADYVHPDWHKTSLCLLQRFPDLLSSSDEDGGISCTGVMGDKFPQLAIANQAAATMALSLLWTKVINQAEVSEQAMKYIPHHISRTISNWTIQCKED